ncbi:MAG TPA: RNB domain-containing ribonuclease [Candidatus Binataceae bacterium]|nr:RNB domain-containing ribonuclease [Candidatus Binataceae bacterium]
MAAQAKYLGSLVEYLDQGRFRAGLVTREQDRHIALLDAAGREKLIARDLVLVRYADRKADPSNLAEVLGELDSERAALSAELDMNLLWEVVHEQGRAFTADELAELFFGRRSAPASSVMLEALLSDRLYFTRRHMDFQARTPEQVERLRVQSERIRMRSDEFREMQRVIRQILHGASNATAEEAAPIVAKLKAYIENPSTRSRDLTAMLEQAAPDIDPAEAAFEILDRVGEAPKLPRFATIAGLRSTFSEAVMDEASKVQAPERPESDGGFSITIDDEETVEIDDALSCESLPDGALRVRVHIALVADFVTKDGPMDREAAHRATTVYLPETTVRMLPDQVSCEAASLIAGERRPVLTTDVTISATGEVTEASIYPARIRISHRLDYDRADRILNDPEFSGTISESLGLLNRAANQLRERRRRAGALLIQRREAKVRVRDSDIQIELIDTASPSRLLVGEFMVLSNYVAARYAADHRIPIIYRVQPRSGDFAGQRPRLSLYPEYHAGIGLDYYAQFSSPIRRYADLVLQRQLLAALARPDHSSYSQEELLAVLAGAENAEAEGRELERRAKRYWVLRYLERHARDTELTAVVTRDGVSAELVDYSTRGTLHGAPHEPVGAQIIVQIGRIDALRGWLTMDYVRPGSEVIEEAP